MSAPVPANLPPGWVVLKQGRDGTLLFLDPSHIMAASGRGKDAAMVHLHGYSTIVQEDAATVLTLISEQKDQTHGR